MPDQPFDLWIAELEIVMDEWGKKHGGRPYGDGTLAETTGIECWKPYFDTGYSPLEAFAEDQTYWE